MTNEEYTEINKLHEMLNEAAKHFSEAINNINTTDVQKVRHGKWNFINSNPYCSKCKIEPYRKNNNELPNYCPNCGAKMDVGSESND